MKKPKVIVGNTVTNLAKNASYYVEGNINYSLRNTTFKNTKANSLAKYREKICMACPFLKNENKCGKCGCEYPEMLYSIHKNCPINKW